MLLEYVQAAIRRAKYELLKDGEGFFGHIPGFKGLWANADTLEGCREELLLTLEDWLLIKLRHDDNDLPVVAGINLNNRAARRSRQKVA